MWKSERLPRWFSTEMNCPADGRYFTSTRYSCSSPASSCCEMRKSGEKSSRPKRKGDDFSRRNGATSYLARRKIDSTRASAIRLLASRRSIPPPWPSKPAPNQRCRHSIIRPAWLLAPNPRVFRRKFRGLHGPSAGGHEPPAVAGGGRNPCRLRAGGGSQSRAGGAHG